MKNLPNEILYQIFEYDSTYKDKYDKVLDQFVRILDKYDKLFWNYHQISLNVWNCDKKFIKWIQDFGINYNPNKFILCKKNCKIFSL